MNATQLAESIRHAILQAAIAAYEDAGLQGLCEEGRWEAAVSAIRALDLTPLNPGISQPSEERNKGEKPGTRSE